MSRPVLIDTDMGVDDAVAVSLALGAADIDVVGVVGVGGNVSASQATRNIGRLLAGVQTGHWPRVGCGLDRPGGDLQHATQVFGRDGLGEIDLPVPADFAADDYLEVYEESIEAHGDSLVVLALGPLTNLAAALRERPVLLTRVGQIVVMGGAVWCPGNATAHAEFNFYRDVEAAAAVLASGLPITVVPLDVTRQVAIDESHVAHLSRSGTRGGELLAQMIRFPIGRERQGPPGTFLVHDAVAAGVLLWPELFMRSKMALEMVVSGEQAGRCKPMVAKDKRRQLAVVISVNVVDFLENLLEQLCQEKFVV